MKSKPERLYLTDWRNLALIAAGFLLVLVLISPARAYPIIDDWIYHSSVGGLLNFDYHRHDWSQAIGLGHFAWGVLFAGVLGNTFTVLTIANLTASLLCLLIFYVLLRTLRVESDWALVGVLVLALNPVYLFLSYS